MVMGCCDSKCFDSLLKRREYDSIEEIEMEESGTDYKEEKKRRDEARMKQESLERGQLVIFSQMEVL